MGWGGVGGSHASKGDGGRCTAGYKAEGEKAATTVKTRCVDRWNGL